MPGGTELSEQDLFGREYLIRRPLLRALEHPGPRPAVLLIDEIDRADDDFEAFLLELLAEAAVTIPEIGTIRATHPPIIVLTSNRTRDLHDAVKRRCLYQWIDYPTPQREVEIVRRRVRGASETLAVQVADAVARMRDSDVQKPPGVAEAIDWVAALAVLGVEELDAAAIDRTLGSVLKYSEDQEVIRAGRPRAAGGPAMTRRQPFRVRTLGLDLPAVAGAFNRRLHEAGVPVTAERAALVRAGAGRGRADLSPAAVLDRARGVRLRPDAGAGVRLPCSSPCSDPDAPSRDEPASDEDGARTEAAPPDEERARDGRGSRDRALRRPAPTGPPRGSTSPNRRAHPRCPGARPGQRRGAAALEAVRRSSSPTSWPGSTG